MFSRIQKLLLFPTDQSPYFFVRALAKDLFSLIYYYSLYSQCPHFSHTKLVSYRFPDPVHIICASPLTDTVESSSVSFSL